MARIKRGTLWKSRSGERRRASPKACEIRSEDYGAEADFAALNTHLLA